MRTIKMVKVGGQWVSAQAKKTSKVVAAGATTMAMSAGAFAVDHSTTISAAGADGTTNVTAATVAVIGIVAVVTGIGFIIKLLSR